MAIIRYSADELLKTQPRQLEGFEVVGDFGEDNDSVNANHTAIFCKSYDIAYTSSAVIVRFRDKNKKIVGSISVFGSNEHKKDESFLVEFNSIISETSYRCISDLINNN